MITSKIDIKQLKIKKGDLLIPAGIYGNKIHFIIEKNKKTAFRKYGINQDVDDLTMEMFGLTESGFKEYRT
jgi:hypothetical protein